MRMESRAERLESAVAAPDRCDAAWYPLGDNSIGFEEAVRAVH